MSNINQKPFAYYGAKINLSPEIIKLIPKHTVYVEPFCGSATIFFTKPFPQVTNSHHYREVLNDHDESIINFFKILQDEKLSVELAEKINLTPYSEKVHRESKIFDRENKLNWAYQFYANAQMSFSGKIGAGWRRATFGRNAAMSFSNSSDLRYFAERLLTVYLSCDDALKIIKDWDSPQTFFYLDTPYPEADQGHYAGYTTDDFKNLCSVLNKIEGSFLLSCYDIGIKPENVIEHFFNLKCSANKVKINEKRELRTEVIYQRFSVTPRQEIIKLYESGAFDCYCCHPWERATLFDKK